MSDPIYIARQDTLENDILPAHWLSHYKLFGEESYTFQNKEIWKKLCMSSAAANDMDMNGEALEEMLTTFSAESLGKWMLLIYGLDAAALEGFATMTEIAANATAMDAVTESGIMMHAVLGSKSALAAITNSGTAMEKIVASATAMEKIAASATAMDTVAAYTTAMDALYARKKQMKGASASKKGKFIILEISAGNAFGSSKYGYATLSDGSEPSWSNYLAKYAFFKRYPQYATYMKNDTDSDDYIYYFDIASP